MAGEVIKPNAFQKFLHRFFMIRSVTGFFAPRIHRMDIALLELTKGRHSLGEIMGWPILEITTIGAKTNQPRRLPLLGFVDSQKIAIVATGFGREHNPGWYYNLKTHPECDVLFNGRSGRYVARETEGEEYNYFWEMAVSYYAGYEKYRERAAPRRIPVMALEPKK